MPNRLVATPLYPQRHRRHQPQASWPPPWLPVLARPRLSNNSTASRQATGLNQGQVRSPLSAARPPPAREPSRASQLRHLTDEAGRGLAASRTQNGEPSRQFTAVGSDFYNQKAPAIRRFTPSTKIRARLSEALRQQVATVNPLSVKVRGQSQQKPDENGQPKLRSRRR